VSWVATERLVRETTGERIPPRRPNSRNGGTTRLARWPGKPGPRDRGRGTARRLRGRAPPDRRSVRHVEVSRWVAWEPSLSEDLDLYPATDTQPPTTPSSAMSRLSAPGWG